MTMPNFLVIGAAKAGTTALYHQLAQHPDVFMSTPKEPLFFALDGTDTHFHGPDADAGINRVSVRQLAAYERLFSSAREHRAIGEASTGYLYYPQAPQRIHHHIPDARLVAVLRHPVDRAFSSYSHMVRDGYESLSFEDALNAEPERIRAGWQHLWHYTAAGRYSEQVQRYLQHFDRAQLAVFTYDEYTEQPEAVLRAIFTHLGIDANFTPDVSLRYNVSGAPKVPALNRLINKNNPVKAMLRPFIPRSLRQRMVASAAQMNRGATPVLTAHTRQRLLEQFLPEIDQLEQVLQRDLAAWRTAAE